MLGCLPPLRAQLVCKADPGGDIFLGPLLRSPQALSHGCNAQLPVHHNQIEHIAIRYPQRFPHRSRYHKTSFRPNAHPNPMILNKLGAFPNDLWLLKFQSFHASHPLYL